MSTEILKKLDEYALGLLDEDGYQLLMKKKVSKKQLKKGVQQDGKSTISARQKKKLKKTKKRLKGFESEKKTEFSDNKAPEIGYKKSYRERILEEMGLTLQPNLTDENPKETCNKEVDPKVTVFYDAAKKRKMPKKDYSKSNISSQEGEAEEIDEEQPAFNFKKVRYEVLKFGISGFEKVKKEEAKIALAIKLGATPPKRAYVNYRQLMETQKKQKVEDKTDREMNRKLGVQLKPISRRPNKRNRNDVAGFDTQVGKYRDGVQFVKKNDLKFYHKRKL